MLTGEVTITVSIHTIADEGSVVHLLLDGEDSNTPLPLEDPTAQTTLTASTGRH